MFLSVQELVDLKHTNPAAPLKLGYYDHTRIEDITKENAEKILAEDLRRTLNRQQWSKANRPWDLVNITEKLDPEQPWFGFEYETGLSTNHDYQALVNHVWHSYNHVAFDLEGYGLYCPEITYPPQNLEEYTKGTSYIQRTIKWMNDNNVKMADFGAHYVGTHLNISTPAYRNADAVTSTHVHYIINHSLLMLSEYEMKQLFGRKMYGVGNNMGKWIEYKMFRSTDNLEVFDKYIAVSVRMAELIEAMVKKVEKMKINHYEETVFVNNLFDILRGYVPADKMEFYTTKSTIIEGARGWRHGQGLYTHYKSTGVKYAAAA